MGLVFILLSAGVLSVAAARRQTPRTPALAVALLPATVAILLTAYVFSEDSYRRGGISRWDAYRSPGGALGAMYVLSVALLVVLSIALALTARRSDARGFRWAAGVSAVALAGLVLPTFIGFTAS